MPSLSTFGDWLVRRGGSGGGEEMVGVQKKWRETLGNGWRSERLRWMSMRRCLSLCPRIRYLRSDTAFYQAAVIDEWEERGIGYTIIADRDAAVKEVIQRIGDRKVLFGRDGQERTARWRRRFIAGKGESGLSTGGGTLE